MPWVAIKKRRPSCSCRSTGVVRAFPVLRPGTVSNIIGPKIVRRTPRRSSIAMPQLRTDMGINLVINDITVLLFSTHALFWVSFLQESATDRSSPIMVLVVRLDWSLYKRFGSGRRRATADASQAMQPALGRRSEAISCGSKPHLASRSVSLTAMSAYVDRSRCAFFCICGFMDLSFVFSLLCVRRLTFLLFSEGLNSLHCQQRQGQVTYL